MASCLSVSLCPSVTLRYRDNIGWKSSKIILWLVSLWCLLSANPNITNLLQGEHTEILSGIGEGCRKSGFRRTTAVISLKRGKSAKMDIDILDLSFIKLLQKQQGCNLLCPTMYYAWKSVQFLKKLKLVMCRRWILNMSLKHSKCSFNGHHLDCILIWHMI